MSFIKKLPPPPDVKEKQILKAKINSLEFPIDSKYKDNQGNIKQQICFNCQLEDGYEFKSWMSYYERPSDGSNLGQLCLTLIGLTREEYHSVREALNILEKVSNIYVQCTGYREWQGKFYPRFKVVTTRLPPLQTELPSPTPKGPTEETLSFIKNSKEMIVMGVPMNEAA